jgi:hypothetical protein
LTQQIYKFFGLRVHVIRELDIDSYSDFAKRLAEWFRGNPRVSEKNPQLYVHKLSFDIEPRHFTVDGVENRLHSMSISAIVNESQRHRDGIRFINDQLGQRLSPTVKHKFSEHKNTYFVEGSHLRDATHFEEYLATIVHRRVAAKDRKVKLQATAQPTSYYGLQVLKNITGPAVTKFDFHLSRDVQLALDLR